MSNYLGGYSVLLLVFDLKTCHTGG